MPHALLLSPDDQAVSAITGVLEEMSVTCERPLDGVSAAQKLNSQSFDLVLVDCENLPAAKLIFDVCRRGKSGNNSVPIAIVDGRAGLPTAFRLGAELILTKPVAKDQARSIIRNAVGRVRKDLPGNEIGAEGQSSSDLAASASAYVTGSNNASTMEERSQSAAASSSQQPATYAESGPRFARGEVPPSYLTAALSASGLTKRMSSVDDEVEVPAANSRLSPGDGSRSETSYAGSSASVSASGSFASDPSDSDSSSSFSESTASDASSSDTSRSRTESVNAKIARVVNASEDLLMAEFDRREQNELAAAESKPGESKPEESKSETLECDRIPQTRITAKSAVQFPSSRPSGRNKSHAPLVASLMLTVAVAGFYGVWKYQPGFKEVAKPQFDHLLDFAGKSMPTPAKPSAQVTAAKTAAPAPQMSTNPNQIAATASEPETNSAAVTTNAAVSSNPVQPPAATTVAAVSPTAAAAVANQAEAEKTSASNSGDTKSGEDKSGKTKTDEIQTSAIKTDEIKTSATKTETASSVNRPSDAKKDVGTATASAQLPGESSAIILSSKGAEKRLAHSVPPKFPAEANSSSAKATVVLKTMIDENGEVAGVRLVVGNIALAPAAMQAVRQWRYRPYVRDGKAQPFQTLVILDVQHP